MKRFRTTTYGKWILAGEHAVLRGSPALAFPLTSLSLDLSFEPTSEPLAVEFSGPHGVELNLLFYGVLENALNRLKVSEPLKGKFLIHNALPIGAGLGASAALCGAIGRWCEGQGWIGANSVYEFSRKLEDLFHGESSGVDLAVALSAQGVRFVRGGLPIPIKPVWWPRLYLSYSGQRGMTSDCVTKVKKLFQDDPERGEALDQKMRQAVELAENALMDRGPEAWAKLVSSLDLARHCFQDWDLCHGDLQRHMDELKVAGASALKPTGSGGGGYVLSLWKSAPPQHLSERLLQVPQPNL